jgi:SSS family solute:Na+ symporter
VSYLTTAPAAAQVTNLTFGTVTPENREKSRASWNRWDVINSGIVLGLILLAYLYFTG